MRGIFGFVTGPRAAWVILVGCVLALVATVFIPPSASSSPDSNNVSAGDSQRVDAVLAHFTPPGTSSALLLWRRGDGGALTSTDRDSIDRTLPDVAKISATSAPTRPELSAHGTAMLLEVHVGLARVEADATTVVDSLRHAGDRDLTPALRLDVTGTVVAAADNQRTQASTLLWVLLVLGLVVAVVMRIITRNTVAWLAELVVSGASVWISLALGGATSDSLGIPFSAGAETILLVLVLCGSAGACLTIEARYRAQFRATRDPRGALRESLPRSARTVAAGTVVLVAGLLPLVLAQASETRAVGIAGALAVVLTAALSLLLLPALFALLGAASSTTPSTPRAAEPANARFRPIPGGLAAGAVLCLIGLGLVASGLAASALNADAASDANRQTQHQIDRTFPVGHGNEAIMLVPRALRGSTSSTSPNFTAMLLPTVQSVVLGGTGDGWSELIVAVDADPGSPQAVRTIQTLRRDLASTGGPGAATLVGGPDARALDARNAASVDLATVLPITAAIPVAVLVVVILGERRQRTTRKPPAVKPGTLVP